ncbi:MULTISPECIES: capsule assembly Wzi family protein [unclassified Pseudoalteromonas]|uniref:capsule assembly Wzi family protein n=1 Tax=unclassified Pseudoalteromonas TaxID=194690 RepID=UPI002096982B|nr:capsule assembly Wzi family protein [Pseudoalteromonas sp. XMcav2-N]MCO7188193.1 capsule assembly Wzi family protein [Pseudoalteromonas sp. XMcav2-N]
MSFRKITLSSLCLLGAAQSFAMPTAFLPLGKDNILEYQIDQMFALTGTTPMAKPYRITEVNKTLFQLKTLDPALFQSIKTRLAPYLQRDAITRRGVKLRIDSGETQQLANDRGNYSSEYAELSLDGVWRGSDTSLVQIGAEYRVDAGKTVPYNTFYALGGENLQLTLGYKEHWFSPFKHSAQVYSNNAKTPLSASLGLNLPLDNWWNFDFELFYSELEHVEKGIHYQNELHDGTPKLAGTHISFEPLDNWKIGINRMMQFGGGPRKVDLKDVVKAYFDPAGSDNRGLTGSMDNELGDQWATITSTFTTNWIQPVQWYLEYGGEDTKNHKNYQFGNTVVSFGVYFPSLTKDITLRYEYTNMHSLWYVNEIYAKAGNTIDGFVVGHAAANQRTFGDAAPTDAHMLEVSYRESLASLWRVKLSTVDNTSNYLNEQGQTGDAYEQAVELSLSNTRQMYDKQVETALTYGKDVFGESYTWLSVNVYW